MQLNFIESLLYIFFDFFTLNVRIGISKDIGKGKRHGIAWVQCPMGGIVPYPFIVDGPDVLRRANMFTINSIFNQLNRMGFFPKNLEIVIEGKRIVFKAGKIRPVLIQRI